MFAIICLGVLVFILGRTIFSIITHSREEVRDRRTNKFEDTHSFVQSTYLSSKGVIGKTTIIADDIKYNSISANKIASGAITAHELVGRQINQ